MLPIVIIGRFVSTMGLVKILDNCCKYNSGIRTSEIFFMGFAGIIRGAVAFGLVLRIDMSVPNRGLIITTALTIVVFTTIVFGFFVGFISNCIKQNQPSDTEILIDVSKIKQTDSAFQNDDDAFKAVKPVDSGEKKRQRALSANESQYSAFEHPNLHEKQEKLMPVSPTGINIGVLHSDSSQSYEDQVAAAKPEMPENLGFFAGCLYILDTKFLKPALVYKYSQEKVA